MDNKIELEQISKEIHDALSTYTQGGKFNNQIMFNSFVLDQLAIIEQRLRKLEAANGNPI